MLRLGTTGLFICDSQERPRLSRGEAEALLRRCLADEATIRALRTLLGSTGTDVWRLDDPQILTELAQKIETGELLLFGEVLPVCTDGGGRKDSGAPIYKAPPRPARARANALPTIQEDSPLFPAKSNLAALAATMQSAADRGAPFCVQ